MLEKSVDTGRRACEINKIDGTGIVLSCVTDLCHFGTDPDPRIRTSDSWVVLQILLISLVTFKTPSYYA
jgi:hypothetical protein